MGIVTAIWCPARFVPLRLMPSCWQPAATATCSSSRPTPRDCNVTAAWRAHRKGALFANPCFTQIHPTCIPASDEHQSKLTLMSESLRNDGRIWVPLDPSDQRQANEIPEAERDYYLERMYPAFGNLVPARRRLTGRHAHDRRGTRRRRTQERRLSGLCGLHRTVGRRRNPRPATATCSRCIERITDENPYEIPMRIYPAPHYTMGGLWVDYNLMTTVPGLYAIGEANFSDHGANRLGASALMQGLADGYFVIPYTIGDYLADYLNTDPVARTDPVFRQAEQEVNDRTNASCRSTAAAPWTGSTVSSARS